MKSLLSLFIATVLFTVAANAQDTLQQQYVGKYKFAAGSPVTEVEVVLQDGVLTMHSAAGSSVLRFEKTDQYTIVAFNGLALFTRNQVGKVAGVHIEAMGYVMDGTKEEEFAIAKLWMNRLLLR